MHTRVLATALSFCALAGGAAATAAPALADGPLPPAKFCKYGKGFDRCVGSWVTNCNSGGGQVHGYGDGEGVVLFCYHPPA